MAGERDGQRLPLEAYRPYLLLLARLHLGARLRGKVDASDLVQETLLKDHQHENGFQGRTDGEMRAWLGRILTNTLADAGRRLGREPQIQQALAASSARLESWLADEQSTPSEHLQKDERL